MLDIQTSAFIEFTTRDTVRYIQSLNILINDAFSIALISEDDFVYENTVNHSLNLSARCALNMFNFFALLD